MKTAKKRYSHLLKLSKKVNKLNNPSVEKFQRYMDRFDEKLEARKENDPRDINGKMELRKRGSLWRKEIKVAITPEKFWEVLVEAILVVRHNSSNDDAKNVAKKLPLKKCCKERKRLQDMEKLELYFREMSNIYPQKTKAHAFALNLETIVKNKDEIIAKLEELRTATLTTTKDRQKVLLEKEREAAKYLQDFYFVGPKTSRNILQKLNLSCFVIPIDSRVMKEAKKYKIKIKNVANEKPYQEAEDKLIHFANEVGILPTQLDGYLFFHKDIFPGRRKKSRGKRKSFSACR